MSKFLQENYGCTNSEAGHYASIPYVMASFVVPLFGQMLAYLGEGWYEKLLASTAFLIGLAHTLFLFFLMNVDSSGMIKQ